MKILFVLSRFPYPLMKGDKLRAFHQIRMLSKNNEVHLVAFRQSGLKSSGIAVLKKYCSSIEILPLPRVGLGINLIKSVFNSKPFQVNYFTSSKIQKKIAKIIEEESIDVVFTQLVRMVENIPFGLKTVYHLDYMDAMSANMERRFHHSTGIVKKVVGKEKERLKVYEREIAQNFDSLSAISEPDAKLLGKLSGRAIEIMGNGVNEDFLNFDSAKEEKKYDLIFTGNMGYHPNIKACEYLVEKILPILDENYRPLTLCLAGTNPAPEVKKMASDRVTVTGFVEDLRPYLAQSRIFVAPLFSGSGLQNKLLESMAIGLPSLTTNLVNKALKAEPKKEIIVCNDMVTFAKNIVNLIENPEQARELGENGSAFIRNTYSWERFGMDLESFLQNIVAQKKL